MAKKPRLTDRIAAYCADTRRRKLPANVVEKAKHHLLDTLAAVVSGARMEPGRLAYRFVRGEGGRREASVLGSRFQTTAINAALSNGMAAHADETDDSHPGSITHPGCAVVPAALAMAERQNATGLDLLKAVALGYDITARFGAALGGGRFLRAGWDSHAFGGTMGAGAAAGSLLTDDPQLLVAVLSYTAQQASGLSTLFRDREHVEKAFVFGGMPARDGVAAAVLAGAGWSGVPDAFDGEPSFFSAYPFSVKPEKWFRDLGRKYAITETNIKRWSVGSPVQAALDSLEALIAGHRFDIEEIASVRVHLPADGARVVDGRNMPDVNVQYLSAVMLLDSTVSFAASHDHGRTNDPAVAALRGRVELVASEMLMKAKPARQAIVEINLNNGRTLKHRTRAVRGTVDNPMTWDEIKAKAYDLMAPVLGDKAARQVARATQRLDQAKSLGPLIEPMRR